MYAGAATAPSCSGFAIGQICGIMGACLPSSAAAPPTPAKNAGTSITVTCASARSRSAPACRLAKILGVGPDGASYSNGNVA